MSRLLDPTVCPDCRSPLAPDARCTGCGLVLSGPLAARLYQSLVVADRHLEELRASGVAATAVAASSPAAAAPAGHEAAPRPSAGRVPGRSVPGILLGLGALCLLVAAVVFVAVTWSVLGITGRTLVLLGITGLLAAGADLASRRGLRAAAECLWLLVSGMLVLDLAGAHSAGFPLLSDLGSRGMGAVIGLVLAATGAAVGLLAGRRPVQRLYGVQLAGGLGLLITTVTNAWAVEHPAPATVVAVVVLAALGHWLRGRLAPLAHVAMGLAATSWLALVAIGLARLTSEERAWYVHLDGWPLLAAAALAAALTVARLDAVVRAVAAFGAVAAGAAYVLGPRSGATVDAVQLCAVVLALAAGCLLRPGPWRQATGLATALGVSPLVVAVLTAPWAPGRAELPSAWVWSLVGPVVVVAALSLAQSSAQSSVQSSAGSQPGAARRDLRPVLLWLAPAVVLLGLATTLSGLDVSAWAVAGGFLAVAAAAVPALALGAEEPSYGRAAGLVQGGAATALVALGTVDALHAATGDPGRLALVALVAAALLATCSAVVGGRRAEAPTQLVAPLVAPLPLLAPVFSAATTLLVGLAVEAWCTEVDASLAARSWALAGLVAVGLLGSAATRLDDHRRVGVELALVPVALAAIEPVVERPADLGVTLTVIGSALALVGVLDDRRDAYRWVATAVLALATFARLSGDVSAPEVVTLPATALLLAAGAWALLRERDGSARWTSYRALGPGLVLGFGPSLLIALDEPVTLRGALVAAAALVALAVGLERRWAMPVLTGAAVGAALALRHLAPLADAVPRWASLGAVGLLLLLVGVTWESRMRDVARAGSYLRALR